MTRKNVFEVFGVTGKLGDYDEWQEVAPLIPPGIIGNKQDDEDEEELPMRYPVVTQEDTEDNTDMNEINANMYKNQK